MWVLAAVKFHPSEETRRSSNYTKHVNVKEGLIKSGRTRLRTECSRSRRKARIIASYYEAFQRGDWILCA